MSVQRNSTRYRTYPVPFFFVVLFLSFGSMGSQMLLQTQHTNTCNSLSIYNQSKHEIGRNTTFQIITIRPTNLHKSLWETPHKKNDRITMIITSNNQVPEQNSNINNNVNVCLIVYVWVRFKTTHVDTKYAKVNCYYTPHLYTSCMITMSKHQTILWKITVNIIFFPSFFELHTHTHTHAFARITTISARVYYLSHVKSFFVQDNDRVKCKERL